MPKRVRCQIKKQDGTDCERWAKYRVLEPAIWVCGMHKRGIQRKEQSDRNREKRTQFRKRAKLKKLEKIRKRLGAVKCAFSTKTGDLCQGKVTKKLEDGRMCCWYHYKSLERASDTDTVLLETMSVDTLMEKRIKPLKGSRNDVRRVINLPDIDDQLEKLDELADKMDDGRVRFRKENDINTDPNTGSGVRKSAFYGIDVEYYTPEFKYDYVYMLMKAIRRAEAQVNIYYQQLRRIEEEEAELKSTDRSGTMATENGLVEFKNREVRHSVPVELKLKLMDNLTKAESHYAKLLKQLQELPLIALMVLRKMGVKWDRDAAMMIINKIEKQEGQVLTDFGVINADDTPKIGLETMSELVQQDPQMAKSFRRLATDDDW